jgi:flagellar hook-associated protein 2
MADPISNISGLASGIQWRDLVDQIMALDAQRRLDPVTRKKTQAETRLAAWNTWQTLVTRFRDTVKLVRDPTAFSQFKVPPVVSAATGRNLLNASATLDASPGSYAVEVLDLARANKLSGTVHSSPNAALGITGEFAVNGRAVTVIATDTLSAIRDKINAVNGGTSASRVSASVLSTGASQYRLVLTADRTGRAGVELLDDAAGTLQALGLVDGTSTLNIAPGGALQSSRFSSATVAIATMLGVTMPPPSTITVGGRTITVDLSVESLSAIHAKILAAGASASVETEAFGAEKLSRLTTSDTVGATTSDGQRVLQLLGFTIPGRSGVAHQVTSVNTYSDASDATATASTLLTDLRVNGNPLAIAAGDTFMLQGTRADGTAVTTSLAVGSGDTLQTMLDRLNDISSGFGAGPRPATASLVNGQIVLTDSVAGDSQLGLTMSVTTSGGSVINVGAMATTVAGRLREVSTGADAQLRIDGVLVTRSSNTISDALTGVTLDLLQAEVGTTASLVVGRDDVAITKSFSDVAAAYNELVKFREEQGKPGAALHNDSTLRSGFATITSALLTTVPGASAPYTIPGLTGLSLQKDGKLVLDANAFMKAMQTNLSSLTRLYATSGYATSADVTYFTSSLKSAAGIYAVDITAAATVPSIAGTGFSGTYTDDGTPDTISITEAISGQTVNVSLNDGDTIDTIVGRLNSAFTNSKMSVTASKNGNDLVIAGTQYGAHATITVAFTAGGADATAQLGLAAGTYAGTDVAGTIGGLAAMGQGQILAGVSGGVTDGLSIRYTGAATGNQGTIEFVLGASGALYNAADYIGAPGGVVTDRTDALQKRIQEFADRADGVQKSLDRRRDVLVKQFIAMETAMSRLQQQSAAMSTFLKSFQSRTET